MDVRADESVLEGEPGRRQEHRPEIGGGGGIAMSAMSVEAEAGEDREPEDPRRELLGLGRQSHAGAEAPHQLRLQPEPAQRLARRAEEDGHGRRGGHSEPGRGGADRAPPPRPAAQE